MTVNVPQSTEMTIALLWSACVGCVHVPAHACFAGISDAAEKSSYLWEWLGKSLS